MTKTLFDHPLIQVYTFENVPLDRDIFMMAEKWMARYERALIRSVDEKGPSAYQVGYYARAAARAVDADSIDLSWYPNTHDRFHEMHIRLPRAEFITCVGSWQYDYKPVIFVRTEWLNSLHLRRHSVFALVDAIGVKCALAKGELSRPKLIELRSQIDLIAAANPDVAFVSFADSLLLKSNYTIGSYDSTIQNTYSPERIIRLLPDLDVAYQNVLGLKIYAAVTQGGNEYYDDGLIHISKSRNHVSLNSLGIPFAQTIEMEHQARSALKAGVHPPADLYLDETFYHSLRFKPAFNKNSQASYPYRAAMMSGQSRYYPLGLRTMLNNLEPITTVPQRARTPRTNVVPGSR